MTRSKGCDATWLVGAITPPAFPAGYCVRTFVVDDAEVVHRLLEAGYAQGGGEVRSFEEWLPSLRADDEFAADLCFLAINERRDTVGLRNAGPVRSLRIWSCTHSYGGKESPQLCCGKLSVNFSVAMRRTWT